MQLGWIQITMSVLYLLLIVGVGLYMSRRVKSSDDYWVGGREVGPFTTALSYCAAYVSTVAIIGNPPMYYRYGLGFAGFGTASVCLFVACVIFIVLAPKMRALSERLDAVSFPGFMAVRYSSNKLRLVCALLIAVMMIPYSISAVKGIADALNVVAGVPYAAAVVVLTLVAIFYLVTSGYWGVATTDLIQGLVISISLLAVAVSVLFATGGLSPIIEYMKTDYPQHLTASSGMSWPALFSYAGVWSFIAFGQPQLIAKFMGLKDARTMGVVIRTGIVWMAVFMISITILGIGALYLFQGRKFENIDMIAPSVVAGYTGPYISGLFLCGILAAGLSTIVALVLTASSAVAKDIFEDYRSAGKKSGSADSVRIGRIFTGVILVVTALGALYPPDFVWSLSTMAGGVMGAAFTAPLILGLYWQRATPQGAYVAVVSGAVVSIAWYLAGLTYIVHSFVPGIVVSFVLMYAVSLMTKPMPKDHVDVFFEAGCSQDKIDAAIASGKA